MLRFVTSLVLLVAAVFTTGAVARAADWCFDADSLVYVFQNFQKPAKGSCKPVLGHFSSGSLATISGVACLSSDGDTLRVGYFKHGESGNAENGKIVLPYPSLTGGTVDYLVFSGGSAPIAASGPASAAVCDPPKQPVP